MQTGMTRVQQTRAVPGLALVGMSVLWGSSWIVSPLVGEVAEPFAATALLFAIATVAVAVGTACIQVRKPAADSLPAELRGPAFSQTLMLSLFLFLLPTVLLIVARSCGAAGWVPFLYAFLPLGLAFAAEKWNPAMVVAVGAVLVLLNGTVPLVTDRLPAAGLVLIAVVSQGFALRMGRKVLWGKQMCALLPSLGMQCFLVAVAMEVLSLFFDRAPRLAPWREWQTFSVLACCLLAVFATAIPYALLYWLLARSCLEPYQLATTQWLQTFVFSAESAWFARIVPQWLAWVAGAAIVAATLLVILRNPGDEAVPVIFRGSSGE